MSRNHSLIHLVFASLLTTGLSVPALAQSTGFPTYMPGENTSATTGPTYSKPLSNPWVVSDGTIITPAGTQVYLGITTRAKAIALNPTGNHTAAVLQMGAPQAVTIFNTKTGAVLQTYSVPYTNSNGATSSDSDGSTTGITYTPDGKYLLFSQDGSSGPSSYVSIATVSPSTGLLSNHAQVKVPIDTNSVGKLTNVTCYTSTGYDSHGLPTGPPAAGVSPPGTTGSFAIPCGYPFSVFSDQVLTSYPMGIAISPDAKTAYAVLDNNDTLTKIDLTASSPSKGAEIRVGNVPHSVVISADGKTAYVSNEAGRIANADDFQEYSNGTPVVARYPEGSTATGTVSVVDLASFTVTDTIFTGLHPTGMAFWGKNLLVANAYSDSISVIDTVSNKVVRTIDLGLPISVPGENRPAYGATPNSIAVDDKKNVAYVALYNSNAVAVVDLNNTWEPIEGAIPVGYAPSSVVLDTVDDALLVANDKGLGTTGFGVAPPPTNSPENSYAKEFGVTDFNTHQDLGTVSIIPVPKYDALVGMTRQVYTNNHWDLTRNIWSAGGGDPFARPVAIPRHIGEPSKIKHVFVIIRENRTYDQMLGDVAGGNGDPVLAVFGDGSAAQSAYGYAVTPNAHSLVERFPLFDNFYDPSRQSADGHNWITQAMAPYADDIQSPDWLRDYPSNGGDAIAYQKKGHLWDVAAQAGVSVKNYGEYIEYNTFNPPNCTLNNSYTNAGTSSPTALPFTVSMSCEPKWIDWYNDVLAYESGKESQLYNYNYVSSYTPLPNLYKVTVQRYPQFDLNIPDQYRFDVWQQDFNRDVAAGKVPQLEFMWISSDHTGGPPMAQAMQADNDLALGRFVDAISHSPIWKDSAIFVEEDDAQTGVDHVDGHRGPGYVISPYVKQRVNSDGTGAGVTEDSTFYTQVNFTRTIEQILSLKPMNQNDLVASPMREIFIDNPPLNNFLPWTHLLNDVPLNLGVNQTPTETAIPGATASVSPLTYPGMTTAAKALMAGWMKKKAEIFAGKYQIPDAEDVDTVSHYDWYEATGFKVPFPGEKKVRPASDFKKPSHAAKADMDDD